MTKLQKMGGRTIAPRHPVTGVPVQFTKWFSWCDDTDTRALERRFREFKKRMPLLEFHTFAIYRRETWDKNYYHVFYTLPK